MARLAQKAAAAAAGAKDGTTAKPPESSSEPPRAWESRLTRRLPDDRGMSALLRDGVHIEAACDFGSEQIGSGTAVHLATGSEMNESPKDEKDDLAGRGFIGGLKENIESLGSRAAALSTLTRRRSRELDAGEG
jgi:hypothetical protein